MKKHIIVLAVLSTLTGAASAATNITLYGDVDVGYEHWSGKKAFKNSGNASEEARDLVNLGLTQGGTAEPNSTFGIKGQEYLGNGLSATFKLEGQFGADDGKVDSASNFFDNESTVGLKGKFGEIKLGRADSQMEQALGDDDIVPGNRAGDFNLYSVVSETHSNGLFYLYDKSRFTFGANVTTKGGANGNTNEGKKGSKIGYGAHIGWQGDVGGTTLTARAVYQNDGTSIEGDKQREYGGLLAIEFEPITVGVAYTRGKGYASDLLAAKFDDEVFNSEYSHKATMLSAFITGDISARDSVYAKWQKSKSTLDNGDTQYNQWVGAVGYEHALSKRTSINADAAYINAKEINDDGDDGAVMGLSLGLTHRF